MPCRLVACLSLIVNQQVVMSLIPKYYPDAPTERPYRWQCICL